MRVEGDMWSAYYALNDTMKGAIFLGSIAMGAVHGNPERKDAFMEMMKGVVGDILEEASGSPVDWNGPERAPEHERAGRA